MVKNETMVGISGILIIAFLIMFNVHTFKQDRIHGKIFEIDQKELEHLEEHARAIKDLQEENKQLKKEFKDFKDEVCKKIEVNCPPETISITFKEYNITKNPDIRRFHTCDGEACWDEGYSFY